MVTMRPRTRAGAEVSCDVGVLVAADRSVRLTGSPYRRWDEAHYDLRVVGPPPLARCAADVEPVARADKDALLGALRLTAHGALLLAPSCSHDVGTERPREIALGAPREAARLLAGLTELGAPSDHPVALDHPEGRYLTGLLLRG